MKNSNTYPIFTLAYLVTFLFLLNSPILLAQKQQKIDSLETVLTTQISERDRVDVLVDLASSYYYIYDNEKAHAYGQEAQKLASSLGYKMGEVQTYKVLAGIFLNQDNYPKAIEQCELILDNESEIEDYKFIIDAYNGLGNAYGGMGRLSEQIKNYYQALRVAEKNQDTLHIKLYKKIIALNNGSKDKLQDLLPLLLEDITIHKNNRDSLHLLEEYQRISQVYTELDSLQKALYFRHLALKLGQILDIPFYEFIDHYQLSEIFVGLNNLEKALYHNEASTRIGEIHGFTDGLISNYMARARLMQIKGNSIVARALLNKCLTIADSINSKRQFQLIYMELFRVDTLEKDYQKAYQHYKQFIDYRDSTYNLSVERNILLEQSKYEKEKAIALERAAQKERNTRNIALVIILALIAVFIYDLIKSRIQKQKLIQQVKEQTKEILHQKDKLEALDQLKTRLYTNITHELRTPLTVILGMTEQIQAKDKKTPLSLVHKSLHLIHRNGKNLLNLINQILDLSKVENNQLSIQLIQDDLVSYVKYISESFHSVANAQNILLTVNNQVPEIIMDFDPEKIRQICSNLLSNAIKYTPSGEKIMINLAVVLTAETNTSKVILKISDTGKGIPPEDLPHIFDRFYQANDDIAKAGGTGIGLALTKELIHILDGEIKVVSEINEGTTFTITLPIHNNAPLETVAKTTFSTHLATNSITTNTLFDKLTATAKSKLLIIEDNADVVEYLKACLADHYQLSFAFNGRIGIELALQEIPDIIISDVMMPYKDGLEVCDTLKNDERTSHIPIILLTAKADIKSRIAGLGTGADAYLAKPFNPEELAVTLKQLIKVRHRLKTRYSGLNVAQSVFVTHNHTTISAPLKQFELEDVFFLKAKSIVEENIANTDFSPQILAKKIGMSYSVMHRKLAALVDRSPSLFIRAIRLHHAKAQLLSSDATISEIAYNTGFTDPKFFSRVFSKEFGITPSTFRKSNG